MTEKIEDLLQSLATGRQTIQKQTNKMREIVEKSNNILLKFEAMTTKEGVEPDKLRHLSDNCAMALIKILEQFHQFMQQSTIAENKAGNKNVLDSYLATRHRVEYLRTSSRKLIAVNYAIAQLKLRLQEQSMAIKEEVENNDCDNEKKNE